MNNLIYTFCFSQKEKIYLKIFKIWLYSIRNFGQFSGKIIVFTDDVDFKTDDKQVKSILLPPALSIFDIFFGKVLLYDKIDLSDISSILYLDLDILVIKKLDSLFVNDNNWFFAVDALPMNDKYHVGFFIKEVLNTESEVGINAGTFSLSANNFPNYMKFWCDIINEFDKIIPPLGDQSFINLLAYRNRNMNICLYPKSCICLPFKTLKKQFTHTYFKLEEHLPKIFKFDDTTNINTIHLINDDTILIHYAALCANDKFEVMQNDFKHFLNISVI